ncbi:MAG: hypothetical protein A2X67_13735 [Ignavibacteria bacterium GWA2_55_11]|nr:MAG: hypothetical protein A2X67_13735 [Ignavibacteria bacterium GWA2_55_11]OGU63197.1 MAG: hypothetical protein A3C56_01655 [Ignavibacteria bacterium RIFCSPHIGHO2_02_FULL_56_12]HAV23935.1 hypothetical protein [Bacteroidota bacterium]
MAESVSTLRLYIMRVMYLFNFVLLGSDVWPELIRHEGPWDPVRGAAYSLWATLSLLSGLGLRYPLQMLPLLLFQLVYKSIWLVAVGIPLQSAGQATEMTTVFLVGVGLDLIVIPWPYVYAHYLKKRGDRWK